MDVYPASATARDRFVLGRRAPRPALDPWRHQGVLVEDERAADGRIEWSGTIFLTGRECPWRCAMCDLWRHTIERDTPRHAIPAQIAAACGELQQCAEPVTQLKLYNAGSFFDSRAVPEEDYDEIAALMGGLSGVVVESHPALIGPRVDRFLEALQRRRRPGTPAANLEVAMGLETVHPEALDRLNKRMTADEFTIAAAAVRRRGASLRAFLLMSPPFVPPEAQDAWLLRSIDTAFASGASVVSLIPARSGNGALEALSAQRLFREPRLEDVERGIEAALAAHGHRGRIFVDLWDLQRFSTCRTCFDARRARLHAVNLEARVLPPSFCAACGFGASG